MDMRAFFIDSPGGTGKSYLLNAFLASVRLLSEESIALAVAASGISATLLLIPDLRHRLPSQKHQLFQSRSKAIQLNLFVVQN